MLLSEEEVFGKPTSGATGAGADATPVVTPVAAQLLSDEEVFGKPSSAVPTTGEPSSPASNLIPDSEVFRDAQPTSAPRRGFLPGLFGGAVSGLLEQNPDLMAETLEGLSRLAPEAVSGTLKTGSEFLHSIKRAPDPNNSGLRFRDIAGLGDALTWAGETLGQGVASTVPSITTGVGGMLAGGAVAGPLGATVGGVGGALIPSAALNYGEVFKELKHHGVDPKDAAEYALYAAIPMAGLDAVSIGPIVAKLGGIQTAKKELSRILAQRIAAEAGKGAAREAVTEAAQEVVKKATVTLAADQPFWSVDNLWDIGEAGIAGGLTGAAMGGAFSAIRPKVEMQPISEAEFIRALEVSGAKRGGGAATPTPVDVPSEGPVSPPTLAQELETQAVPLNASEILEQAPVFFSNAARVSQEKLPETFTGEQMWATLRNTPGVKEEELLALKVPEFARTQEGKISKKDFMAHLEENAIVIKDIVRQDSPELDLQLEMVESQAVVSEYGMTIVNEWNIPNAPGWGIRQVEETEYPFEILHNDKIIHIAKTLAEALTRVKRRITDGTALPPRYSQWQAIKGGENYREFLLQLARGQEEQEFESAHWADPNVIAHYRTSDFNDVEGHRGLMVQEVQSDWHQQGRREGYREAIDPTGWTAEIHKDDPLLWMVNTPEGQFHVFGTFQSQQEAIQQFIQNINLLKVPDAPFKTSWAELTVKRILRQAADEGYSRVYLATGQANADLYPGDSRRTRGLIEFYDKILPKLFDKWAKKLGGSMGKTEVVSGYWVQPIERANDGTLFRHSQYGVDYATPFATFAEAHTELTRLGGEAFIVPNKISVYYVNLTPRMATSIKRGVPMFSKVNPDYTQADSELLGIPEHAKAFTERGENVHEAIQKLTQFFRQTAKRMGIHNHIFVMIADRSAKLRGELRVVEGERREDRKYLINIVPSYHQSVADVYATMAHEFGHLIAEEKFKTAPVSFQLAVKEEYERYRDGLAQRGVQYLKTALFERNNWVTSFTGGQDSLHKINELAPERREYWLGFDEWFAEQVARWFTSDAKPITQAEKFFARVAKQLKEWFQLFTDYIQQTFGIELMIEPSQIMQTWLDTLWTANQPYSSTLVETIQRTLRENRRALDRAGYSDHPASEQTTQTTLQRNLIRELESSGRLVGEARIQAHASAAMADHFSKWYKWGLSVIQLAERNQHIEPLFRYKEYWQQLTLERQAIMDNALTTIKAWRKMSRERADAVSGLLDDYMNMRYLTPQEVQAGVVRLPTQQELFALVQANKVDADGVQLFDKIRNDFLDMLKKYRDILNNEALKIVAPYRRAERLRAVAQQFDALEKQPYFPAMRFGNLTLEIRDAAGNLVQFQTFESKRARAAAANRLAKQFPTSAGFGAPKFGKLPEDAGPLIGLPPGLLDLIDQKLGLNNSQRSALDLLKFEFAPAQSFKHRFERKNRVPGYSMDFQRAYANYFFHGSNHLARVKYVDNLRQIVNDLRSESRQMLDGTKRMEIADFVNDHLNYMLNPSADWSTFRALTFLWSLGFSPAAALLNTSQVLIGSYPILASGFGDVKAIAALTKAGASLATYYKKGTLEQKAGSSFEMRAVSEGVKEGIITEAMAPELAALSEGNNLHGSVGNVVSQTWLTTMEASGKMFELTEQWNRRVTFRAALQLALSDPAAKYVDTAVTKNELQYQRLRQAGWTERESRAFVTAKYAVESTQYIYSQYAQPRLMRGRLRTVFIFKSFMQNTLFMLWNNPSAAARSLLVMAAVGGLMGLPGMDDLKGLIKVIANRVLGSDFDLDEAARKFALDTLNGVIPPDLLLHGLSRYGMGIPAVMNWVGMPAPVMDVSRSVSLGNILPVQLDAMFAGGVRNERQMLDTVQRASGAAFGMGFNIWRALNDAQNDVNSLSRWMKAMPREAQALARFYQAYSDGAIKNRQGVPIVRFDPNDTRHMMEMLAMAGGWQPLRLTAQWDRIIAEREAIMFWDLRRQGLLRQYSEAIRSKSSTDRDTVLNSIRRFNEMLPDVAKAKAITRDTLVRSVATRARLRSLQEQGLPAQKSNVGIVREIQRLHPEAQVDVRGVR